MSDKYYTDFSNIQTNSYSIIYADPPWAYRDKALAGNRGACCKYEVQDLDWIKNLDVNRIAKRDCVLFLWITMPQLNIVMDVISHWGFTYKTNAFTWIKLNKKTPSVFWGMGNWTRANAELCLLATRGKPERLSASVHSVIQSAIEGHSKKPEVARDKIVELCGDKRRIELFARNTSPGWDCFGNEINENYTTNI